MEEAFGSLGVHPTIKTMAFDLNTQKPAEASLIRLASDLDRSKSNPERFGEVRLGRPSPGHGGRMGDIDPDQNTSKPNRG